MFYDMYGAGNIAYYDGKKLKSCEGKSSSEDAELDITKFLN